MKFEWNIYLKSNMKYAYSKLFKYYSYVSHYHKIFIRKHPNFKILIGKASSHLKWYTLNYIYIYKFHILTRYILFVHIIIYIFFANNKFIQRINIFSLYSHHFSIEKHLFETIDIVGM